MALVFFVMLITRAVIFFLKRFLKLRTLSSISACKLKSHSVIFFPQRVLKLITLENSYILGRKMYKLELSDILKHITDTNLGNHMLQDEYIEYQNLSLFMLPVRGGIKTHNQ